MQTNFDTTKDLYNKSSKFFREKWRTFNKKDNEQQQNKKEEKKIINIKEIDESKNKMNIMQSFDFMLIDFPKEII